MSSNTHNTNSAGDITTIPDTVARPEPDPDSPPPWGQLVSNPLPPPPPVDDDDDDSRPDDDDDRPAPRRPTRD